jgi:dihydroceramidase
LLEPTALPGFWGAATATVDWCESNYERSYYVCELFNTVSSLAMVLAGALGIALHRRILEARFMAAFFAVAVVGVGSIAFHATLRFELQMMDELPMLYTALVMVYILVENRPAPRFDGWFPALLATHGVLVTCLTALTRGKLQFYLFQGSFASLEVFALYRVYAIYRRSELAPVRRLFRLGMGSYLLAVLLWFIDLEFCPTLAVTLPAHGVPNPQLHAVWHVLVSCGLYGLVLVMAYDRLAVLGRQPELRYELGFLPYVAGTSVTHRKEVPDRLAGTAR